MEKTLADSKKSRTFASLLKRSTSGKKFWRDGRVVDRGGLENRCTERYRGFESLSLRNKKRQVKDSNLFEGFYLSLFYCKEARGSEGMDLSIPLSPQESGCVKLRIHFFLARITRIARNSSSAYRG